MNDWKYVVRTNDKQTHLVYVHLAEGETKELTDSRVRSIVRQLEAKVVKCEPIDFFGNTIPVEAAEEPTPNLFLTKQEAGFLESLVSDFRRERLVLFQNPMFAPVFENIQDVFKKLVSISCEDE